jgi:hypothetical protein
MKIAVEKANDLFEKMYNEIQPDELGKEYESAKQCAVIAVDEIIEQWQYIHAYIANGMGELSPNLKYWYEVKQELTKQQEQ